jgi:hypothetical protein
MLFSVEHAICHLCGSSALYTYSYGQYYLRLSRGNGHFRTLTEPKSLNRSKPKLAQLIKSTRLPRVPKFIKISLGVTSPHVGDVVGLFQYFFLGLRQPKPCRRSTATYYVSTRLGQRMCHSELNQHGSLRREVNPKSPFWGWGEDFTAKHWRKYLSKYPSIIQFDSARHT